tara:strand:- start:1085 stop:1303 length:219 start_codon:yes stop_codon:yes gene_type:complete
MTDARYLLTFLAMACTWLLAAVCFFVAGSDVFTDTQWLLCHLVASVVGWSLWSRFRSMDAEAIQSRSWRELL